MCWIYPIKNLLCLKKNNTVIKPRAAHTCNEQKYYVFVYKKESLLMCFKVLAKESNRIQIIIR